jgi:4-amino-4-deoxy-L-arabinose transferase-like glycosyltransferase
VSDAPRTSGPAARLAVGTCLATLVAVAAWLRFSSLAHGLPLLRGRPDELEVIQATATFPAWDFNPRFFVYPNFYFYLVFAWIELLLAGRRLWEATPGYATLLQTDVPALILYGRAFTAAVGTASVLGVYAVARRAAGTATGLVAAALVAGNFLHVRDSHALKPDVLLGMCMLATLWLLSRWTERPDRRHAAIAGVAVGLTMAVKYNGIFLLIPAYLEQVRTSSRRGWRRLVPSASLAGLVGVAAVTVLLACPYLWLDLGRTTFTSWFLAVTVFSTRPGAALPAGAGWLDVPLHFIRTRAFGYHLTTSLWHGFGALATLALGPALVAASLRRAPPFFRMGAAFAVVYYLIVSTAPVHLVRYFTALVPLLTVLLAAFVVRAAVAVRAPALRAAVVAAATVALVAEPVASGIAHDRIAAETDTRVLAADWMREHLPAGAVAVVLGATLFTYADPELPPGVRRADTALAVDAYARAGITHVVTHEHQIPFSHLDPKQMAKLAPHLRLLQEFTPYADGPAGGFEAEDAFYIPFYDFAGVVRPGPLVRIYAYEAAP